MTEVPVSLQCNTCKKTSDYSLSEDLRGHKLTVACQHCSQKLNYFFPNEQKVEEGPATGTTIVQQSKVLDGYLRVEDSRGFHKDYILEKDQNIVGRFSKYNLQSSLSIDTDDKTMSRAHCTIRRIKNSRGSLVFTVRDLDSLNGVIVNGRQLSATEEIYLCDDDRLQLGNVVLIFKEIIEL